MTATSPTGSTPGQPFSTDRLAALVQEKLEVLEQLRELSRRQCQLVQDGDAARLLSVLSAKQKLLQDVQQTERKLDPFRHDDPQARRWRSPDHRGRCQQMAARCETLLSEILLLEKQCTAHLEQRQLATANRLQNLQGAAEARAAYAQAPPPSPRQLDLEAT